MHVFTLFLLVSGELLISVSIDQRLAVWQWRRQDSRAENHTDSSVVTSDVSAPPAGVLLPRADNSVVVELKSVRCSSVADIQAAAFSAAHQHQFVICVGTGIQIFRLKS